MSRHRAVRNINLDDELADDDSYGSEENPYDDISEEDRRQLDDAMTQLISVIGAPGQQSGFTEREMKDTLWDAYFNVDQAVTTLIEERSRREQREKRKAEGNGSPEPPSAAFKGLTLRSESGRGRASRSSVSRGEKRSADAPVSADVGPTAEVVRPSKLAALAASRAAKRQAAMPHTEAVAGCSTSTSSKASKPLSKLQQRAQANILARQQRQSGAVPVADDGAENLRSDVEMDARSQVLPNGQDVSDLFPVADEQSADLKDSQSILGRVLGGRCRSSQSAPGQNFLAPDHLEAFDRPSPDDLVLNARAGTKLAQR